MKIAIAQTKIAWKDKDANLRKAREYAIESQKNLADILFFPEMSFTGFCMDTADIGERDLSTVHTVSAMAKEHSVAIGFGWVENTDQLSKNHYTIVDRYGTTIVDYVKLHPFTFGGEHKCYRPGVDLGLCMVSGVRISVFICYDLRFAEPFSISAKNTDLILVAANWPVERREHFRILLRARAVENSCYVAAVNCVGQQKQLSYSGDSCVISPEGKIIFQQYRKEGLFFCHIDGLAENVSMYRRMFPVLQDKRTALYDSLKSKYL